MSTNAYVAVTFGQRLWRKADQEPTVRTWSIFQTVISQQLFSEYSGRVPLFLEFLELCNSFRSFITILNWIIAGTICVGKECDLLSPYPHLRLCSLIKASNLFVLSGVGVPTENIAVT